MKKPPSGPPTVPVPAAPGETAASAAGAADDNSLIAERRAKLARLARARGRVPE